MNKGEIIKNYMKKLEENNCEVINIVINPKFNFISPLCFLEFKYEGYKYLTIVENFNLSIKNNLYININYEALYKERNKYEEFQGTFPLLIIIKNRKDVRYNSKNFEIIYTDFKFTELIKFLI